MKHILPLFYRLILTYLGLVTSFSLMAQTPTKADEDGIKKMVYAFADAYSKLPQTQKRGTILDFFAEDLTSMNVIVRVAGNVNNIVGDYKTFSDYLEKMETTENMKISYKITEIEKIHIRGSYATLVYSVDYEFAKDGSVWSKGTETVTLALKKVNTQWKIFHFTFINIEDEKFKGTCLCEIFASGGGDLIAKATVPNGKSYSTDLNNFVFKGGEFAEKKITVGSLAFTWKPTGELMNGDKMIGAAKTKEEATIVIMQEVIYTNNCSEFKLKKTK